MARKSTAILILNGWTTFHPWPRRRPDFPQGSGASAAAQTPIDSGLVAELVGSDTSKPALSDPWAFMEQVLGWEARHVAGAPGGPPLPDDDLVVHIPEHDTTLRPTWAVANLARAIVRGSCWSGLRRLEVDPDGRNALDGWEATPHQRFERLLHDTGVFAGLLISERAERVDGETKDTPEIRLIYAPRGETSGYQSFPIRAIATVAGRPMLGGFKLLLDPVSALYRCRRRRFTRALEAEPGGTGGGLDSPGRAGLGALMNCCVDFDSRRSAAHP